MHQIRKYLEEATNWKPIYGLVYHYTSPEGFQSIIEHQALRFSRIDCLNDYKENEIVKELYQLCLKELYEEGMIDRDHYDQYLKVVIKHGSGLKRDKMISGWTPNTPYVCCFSLKSDSLQMWQYYSKSGNYEGYNIGIGLCHILDHIPIMWAGKVFYQLNEQKKIIKQTILHIYENDTKDLFEHKDKRYSVNLISSEIAYLGCFIKSNCFAGEEEVRVIVEIPDDPKERSKDFELGFTGMLKMPTIEYRMAHAMMIPYFDLPMKEIGNICSVTIGPITSHRNEAAKKNTEIIDHYLHDKLGRKVETKESIVPVRY